jgi:CheY-like chemotaxis protein/two-component sensor histidine kinase
MERNEYVNILNENNELLLQLISDILDLSKIEAGTFEFVYNNVDIDQLCDDIVRSSQLKVKNDVKITFESNPNRNIITSDRNRLHQILSNFINNAIKFTEKGSITIGYDIDGNHVRFYCKDTGIGITKEQQPSIFERFVKLNSFIKGTGLGLAICQSIVHQMNGEIGVDSEPGKGSTFWFTIPYIKAKNTTNGISHSNEENIRNKEKKPFILVAEDTESNYMLIMAVLSKQYKIIWAHDGVEAVDMCRAMNPDLVLMDPRIPRMNGLEATRSIREFNKNIPIIAVTTFAFEHDKNEAIEAGYDMVLSKPINSQKLRAAINKALEKNN